MRSGTWSSALPGACTLCRRLCHDVFCADCAADLPHLPPQGCPRCALPTLDGGLCGGCIADPPAFDAALAALRYGMAAARLITAAKYAGRWPLWHALATLLAQRLPAAPDVDVIVPVPLHAGRLRERGYNQAGEIANVLARRTRLPVRHDLIGRVRDTGHQSDLSLAERRRNLRGAFAADTAVAGLRIAIVDDVMTSGLTADTVARILKRAGARRVEAWVVARTL
ncbi:hypothetical protein BJP62_03640 [Jeongeupia sp. USM3]|nr:hypothetical protein BJP62_03640 [Jeongeupia sp. USM3]